MQRRWCTGPLTAGHLCTATYVRPVPDAPESRPRSCRVAVRRAVGRWPSTYDHVRTTTYVRPVPQAPASKPHSCTAAGAQCRWPLATYVRPRTYDHVRTAGSRFTGIEARLLQRRWCTGTLAAGHLHTTTYVLPRTYGLFQIHRNRRPGHLLMTTYARYGLFHMHRHRCQALAAPRVHRAAGRGPLTCDHMRTAMYVYVACSRCTGTRGHTLAGLLVRWAAGRWPPTYDQVRTYVHVRTACSNCTGIDARLLQGRWCTGPLAAGHLHTTTYARPVPDAPDWRPGSCSAAGAQGLWPLATYVRPRTYGNVHV